MGGQLAGGLFLDDFVLDAREDRLGLFESAGRLEPARRLGQGLARIPDGERADAAEHEHRAPAECGNQEQADEAGDRQPGHDEHGHQALQPAREAGGANSVEGRVADDVLGAQAHAHHEAAGDQHGHRRRERGAERGDAEDGEIGLVGETPAEAVAEKTRRERAEHHAEEGQRDEQRVLRERREAALQRRAEHSRGDVDIEAIEKHADADQPHDASMKPRHRQPVQPCACIHFHCHCLSPSKPSFGSVPPVRKRLSRSSSGAGSIRSALPRPRGSSVRWCSPGRAGRTACTGARGLVEIADAGHERVDFVLQVLGRADLGDQAELQRDIGLDRVAEQHERGTRLSAECSARGRP